VLDGVGGAYASLARWRGKVVVVNFWASWCDTCVAEAGLIEQAQRRSPRTVAARSSASTTRTSARRRWCTVRRHGLTYPNLRDIDGAFASAYGTAALPETFVLNRRLQVVAISRGELASESQLAGWIRRAERA